MRISGTHVIKAPRPQVWETLTDAESIARCLPGVEHVERVDATRYTMTMTVGIGPIKGTYSGTVALLNVQPPDEYEMEVDASGGPGFVKGTGTVHLSEGDTGTTTQLAYAGDVEVGGPVGSVAQRLLGGVARRLAEHFFDCIEVHLQSAAPATTGR